MPADQFITTSETETNTGFNYFLKIGFQKCTLYSGNISNNYTGAYSCCFLSAIVCSSFIVFCDEQ